MTAKEMIRLKVGDLLWSRVLKAQYQVAWIEGEEVTLIGPNGNTTWAKRAIKVGFLKIG